MLFLSLAKFPPSSIRNLLKSPEEGIELRLDLFPRIEKEKLREFLQSFQGIPVMFTLRQAPHGGGFQDREEKRERLIEELFSLAPPLFDLEYDMRPEFLQRMFQTHPQTAIVLSAHFFQPGIPGHLEEVYQTMARYPAFSYKIAMTPDSTHEALHMLLFAKTHSKASVICMGPRGVFARFLGPCVGNILSYAALRPEDATGAGQPTRDEWIEVYRYPKLNAQTAIYGLIGDPVENSTGHLYHNGVFQKRCLNAIYVKMIVAREELADFFPLARKIGMRGLSVTMPLKEKVLPFLDEIDPAAEPIGAINTLRFDGSKIIGTNTDGQGALDALEKWGSVQGKKIAILGAGGAARAIAFEALKRGARVTLLNRTLERAQKIAALFHCQAGRLDDIPPDAEILIHSSPHPMPIDSNKIPSQILAMDIASFSKMSPFARAATEKGCRVIGREAMFLGQAERQTRFWLGT